MNTDVIPDPAFINALEWQLRRELRRADRFAAAEASAAHPRNFRWLRTASLLLAVGASAALLGAACATAADRAQSEKQLENEVKVAEVRQRAAESAAKGATERLTAMRLLYTVQPQHPELSAAQQQQAMFQALANRSSLDLQELRASGSSPDDRITAPPVHGKDFVMARQLASLAALRTISAEQHKAVQEVRAKEQAGVMPQAFLRLYVANAQAAQADVAEQESLITVRREFTQCMTDALAAEQKSLLVMANHAVTRAQIAVDAAQEGLKYAQSAFEAGATGAASVQAAEGRLAEAKAALEVATAELKQLQEHKPAQ